MLFPQVVLVSVFRPLSARPKGVCETKNHPLCGWKTNNYITKNLFSLKILSVQAK